MPKVVNPIQVQRFLCGVDYPASRQALIETARRHGADATVLETLARLPDRVYQKPTEVAREIGKLT
jgi:hypothetical protein